MKKILILLPFLLQGCNAEPITREYKQHIIIGLSENMIEAYVYEDVARELSEQLQEAFEQGEFDSCRSYGSFAQAINEMAFKVCADKHLRIRATGIKERDSEKEPSRIDAEILPGNIGLLTIHSFLNSTTAQVQTDIAMAKIAQSKAVIVDIRENRGGSPELVRYVCSYFIEGLVLLNSLYWRYNDRTDDFYTLESINNETLSNIPLFILTSGKTFSAAEEFAYNLQSRERAIVVGEDTGGGAHPVNLVQLDPHIEMTLPIGRAINPITQTNWEKVGVTPNVPCPANQALLKALSMINED